MSDFDGACLDVLNARPGSKQYSRNEITQWDLADAFRLMPSEKAWLDEQICTEGFCLGMQVLPGVKDTLRSLREFCDVIAVTAPFIKSKYWAYERALWLQTNLGFDPKHEIVQTHAKNRVVGDILVDDKTETLRKGGPWIPVLMRKPCNSLDSWTGLSVYGHSFNVIHIIACRIQDGDLRR